jgi:hypothetical protein
MGDYPDISKRNLPVDVFQDSFLVIVYIDIDIDPFFNPQEI